jgi:hypothetical protein
MVSGIELMMIHMINAPALLFSVENDSAWERYSYYDVSRVLGFSTIPTVRPDLPGGRNYW